MKIASSLCVGVLLCMASFAAADSVRSGTNYGMQFDVISSGGGASASTGYSQPQAVIGQAVIWNTYTSTNYEFQPVGTFLFGMHSAVLGWLNFEK